MEKKVHPKMLNLLMPLLLYGLLEFKARHPLSMALPAITDHKWQCSEDCPSPKEAPGRDPEGEFPYRKPPATLHQWWLHAIMISSHSGEAHKIPHSNFYLLLTFPLGTSCVPTHDGQNYCLDSDSMWVPIQQSTREKRSPMRSKSFIVYGLYCP